MTENKAKRFSHIQLSNLHYGGDKIGTDWQIILCFPNTDIAPIRIKESIKYGDNPLSYQLGDYASIENTSDKVSAVITAVEVDRASDLATTTGEIEVSGEQEQTISMKVIERGIDTSHIADLTFFFHVEKADGKTKHPEISQPIPANLNQ